MITLVLGGTRSGKSAVAERLAQRSSPVVTYVATMRVGDDIELARRIEQHRRRRPATWATIECGEDLAGVLANIEGTVLVDALGAWLAAGDSAGDDARRDALCIALRGRVGDTIVVSDEVGLGVHPSSSAGREFRDRLGLLNQAVARGADVVLLVVAGRVLSLADVDSP